jgi:hypothetical protein
MYGNLFNEFSSAKYSAVKPKTGKVRLQDIHTELDAVH